MITIVISNYNTLHWLRVSVHQIRKHTKIPYEIVISDQSEDKHPVMAEYNGFKNIRVIPNPRSSSGAGMDYILKNVKIESKYICAIDVDTFPISDDWLTVPIKLIEDFGLTWVGLRAEIESAYSLHYFHMGECYRVGLKESFEQLSKGAGWYQRTDPFFDNAVVAHSWEDKHFSHKKLSLPVTGSLGLTLTNGEYGRVIGNLAVHFCLAFTSTLHANKRKALGEPWLAWEEKIKTLPPDMLVSEIMAAVRYSSCLQPLQYWDGKNHAPIPDDIRKAVELHTHKKGVLAIPLHWIIEKHGLNIKGVIHIGAHYGQEYADYEDNGIKNVIMVEPLSAAYVELVKRMPDSVPCYKLALGNGNGVVTLHTETANEGMSSSILQPKEVIGQYPHIVFDGTEIVNMARLDDMDYDTSLYNMLNIDVQGYELEVLKGATDSLKHIDLIYCEVNRKEMYAGCPMVEDIDAYLSDFVRVETDWIGVNWGDAIFLRKTIIKQ